MDHMSAEGEDQKANAVKNISEIITEATHLANWLIPLISMYSLSFDLWDEGPSLLQIFVTITGVATALFKEISALLPVLGVQLGKAALPCFPPDPGTITMNRRDVNKPTKKLPSELQEKVHQIIAEVRGDLLKCLEPLKDPIAGAFSSRFSHVSSRFHHVFITFDLAAFTQETADRAVKWGEEWKAKGNAYGKSFPKGNIYRCVLQSILGDLRSI
jgi:hypothetical protein